MRVMALFLLYFLHGFLGVLFVQVDWMRRVEELGEPLFPALATLLVAAEPSVRLGGRLLPQ